MIALGGSSDTYTCNVISCLHVLLGWFKLYRGVPKLLVFISTVIFPIALPLRSSPNEKNKHLIEICYGSKAVEDFIAIRDSFESLKRCFFNFRANLRTVLMNFWYNS